MKNDSEIQENSIEVQIEKPPGIGIRHLQILLLFFGICLAFALRSNLSVAIIVMVDNSSNLEFETYDWNESTRGIILSSIFWGYAISPIMAGLLAQKFGGKILLFVASIVCAVLTILTSQFASLGWGYLCASRFVQGLMQGFYFPCIHSVLSKWVHPSERGVLASFAYSGSVAGTAVMLGISGLIASSTMGWPGIFYISGGVTLIWSVLWFWFGCNTPAEYKSISKKEKDFIESMPGSVMSRTFFVPWPKILTSKPFLAIVIAHSAQNWGFYTLLTQIPSYIDGVLKYDIKSNALISALPYLTMFILILILGRLSDYLINNKIISAEFGRKIFNSIGHWIPVVCLIALSYITQDNAIIAVVLLTIGVGCNAGTNAGFVVNHMDLSPNFAGTLMGITNSVGNVMSIIGPLFSGFIVYDMSDPALWRIVFFVTAGYYFIGNLVFVIFGKGTIQKWNDDADNRTR